MKRALPWMLALLSASCGFGTSSNRGAGGFTVKGTLTSPGFTHTKSAGSVHALAAPVGPHVTHVMAVNPTTSNVKRFVAPVAPDGTFELNVDASYPYVLVFVDSTQVGKNMVLGYLKSNNLHTVPAMKSNGTVDLSQVSIQNGTATSSLAYGALLSALGVSADDADELAKSDEVCLRYTNPDIDGNGAIDVLEQNRNFTEDLHTRFNMTDAMGQTQPLLSILNQFPPTTAGIGYTGTGVYSCYPADFYAGSLDGAMVTLGGVSFTNQLAGPNNCVGPNVNKGMDVPPGDHVFSFGGKALTFVDVHTETDAQLQAAYSMILPFVRFNAVDGCTGAHCGIKSMDFEWMRRRDDASGWDPVSNPNALNMQVSDSGGYVSLHVLNDWNKVIGFQFPMTALAGNMAYPFSGMNLGNVAQADADHLLFDQICSMGLSYDSKMGLRMFEGYAAYDPACPAPSPPQP